MSRTWNVSLFLGIIAWVAQHGVAKSFTDLIQVIMKKLKPFFELLKLVVSITKDIIDMLK